MVRRLRPLIGVAFAVVLFGTVEAGLRVAGVGPAYRPEVLGQWRFSANLRDQEERGPRDGHGFRVSTNADGLRTSLPKEHTARRVALLGDSTVFGWGVDDGSTLADGASVPGVEILNAGQPGYSSTMAGWLFREVVAAYTPELTILFIPMHDTNLVPVSDRELLHGGETTTARVRILLARHSRIYELLRRSLWSDAAWLLPEQRTGEPRVPRVSDAERSQVMAEMAEAARAWGGTVAVGYLPFDADIRNGVHGPRPTSGWAARWEESSGGTIYDLRDCCTGGVGYVLTDDIGHLSAAGNLAAGAALGSKLR